MDPDSAVSEVQRRIELQFPEDLAFLIANVRDAATARLNEAFPPVEGAAGEADELRNQIQVLVGEYIDRTFSLAAPNLTINGLPVDAKPFLVAAADRPAALEAYEPFDPRKRSAVAALITQEEKLLEDVAALKRAVPAKVAAEHAERVRAGMKQDEEDLRARVESDVAAAMAAEAGPTTTTSTPTSADSTTGGGTAAVAAAAAAAASSGKRSRPRLGVKDLERQEGVEAGFRDAATGLGRLKRDMPAAVAKMERARLAGEYVVAKRGQ